MTGRHVRICAVAGALALSLGACSAERADQLAPASAPQQAAPSLQQDLLPLHREAVALADAVLAEAPGAPVQDVVRRIRAAQQQLLDQVERDVAAAGHAPGEVAALASTELDAVRAAAGDEAVRLGVDGLLRNHLAVVNRAKAAVLDGAAGADRALADRVLATQSAALQELSALP